MAELNRRKQRTLKKPVMFSGIGIHTGRQVTMRFVPAKEGTGIVFQRTDLTSRPLIPATVEYVVDTTRNTTIGVGDVRVHTVEHVLSAVKAADIDNLLIEVSALEPPVGNGSADLFLKMIEEADIQEQEQTVPIVNLQYPVYWSERDIHIVALPCNSFRVSYTLQYPGMDLLRAQYFSTLVDYDTFKREVAPCRTFSRYDEVAPLMDRGLIKGGSLANAVIIKDGAVLSKNGLHFPDEMARHKVLDIVGDLSLVGFCFTAHIIAIRSGHSANFELAKKLLAHITKEKR